MPQKHTTPVTDWRREIVHKWATRTNSTDPIEAAAAKELLEDFLGTRHPNGGADRRVTATAPFWTSVIDQVILGCSHRSDFKTGHDHEHTSKSGTCVTVTVRKGVWYCSSCKRGGTAIQWVMEREQVSYSEAWDILAASYGAHNAQGAVYAE